MKIQLLWPRTLIGAAAILLTVAPSVRAQADGEDTTAEAKISPALRGRMKGLAKGKDAAGIVIVSFKTATGLKAKHLRLLDSVGVAAPARMDGLGMAAAVMTKKQVKQLAADPSVVSLFENYPLRYSLHQARVLCGVDRLRADAGFTALNGGKVVDGLGDGSTGGPANRPQFSVVVIDSGLDTTGTGVNADLAYTPSAPSVINPNDPTQYTAPPTIPTTKVIQNVQVAANVASDNTVTFAYFENQPSNDSVGHGSHCAGIVGGTGAYSKTLGKDFSGVASGVKIIGCGSGAGLFVLDALGGMNYAINLQAFYNVRITSNSYGSDGPYNPTDPLNVAIKRAYDRNITTVFAAGNSGPGVDTIGIQAKSPYVISVAAGTKEGGLVGFSSRGKPRGERAVNPSIDGFNLPAITAPGTGREFAFDGPADPAAAAYSGDAPTVNANPDTVGKKFTSDIVSTRSKIPGAAAGMNDQENPAAFAAVYTQISGTSMACPFVAGTCALLLDADSTLTPDSNHPAANGRKGIKEILQATATYMPGYQDYEVGAGYLNAYAAVDLAFNPTKSYAPFNRIDLPYSTVYPAFVTKINSGALAPPTFRPTGYPPATPDNTSGRENFVQPYSTQSVPAQTVAAARTKAAARDNAYAFVVDADATGTPIANLTPAQRTTVIDVRLQFGQDSNTAAGQAGGNSIGFILWAPDGTIYSSGIALPVLDSPSRQVVVRDPQAGLWVLELRGLRGLAAVPLTPPVAAGLPDNTVGQIYRTNNVVINPPNDADGIPQTADIKRALLNRYLDQLSELSSTSGLFFPNQFVSRVDFVQVLADNTPLRQSLFKTTSSYTDVSGYQARYAEAAAQFGSTLRDWNFTPQPSLPTNSTTFTPNSFISRMQAATAMVRALGLDAEALKLTGTTVKVTDNGVLKPVVDAGVLSPEQLGYLQLALNRKLMSYTVDSTGKVNTFPTKTLTRAELATVIVNFRDVFAAGNSLLPTEYAPQAP